MNITDFRTMFPVFDDLDDPTIELWAEVAEEHLKASWVLNGKRLEIAMRLMTAHLLHTNNVVINADGTAQQNSSGGGIVASASEGSVSVSFATPPTKTLGSIGLPVRPMACSCGRC